MITKKISLLTCLVMSCNLCLAQLDFNDFKYYYPVGEDPNIRYMTSYVNAETILFEASPNVRYSFYNNFYKGLLNNHKHTKAYYVAVRPQLRMYTDNSLPVKMPSQRVLLGTQHLFRLAHNTEQKRARFLALSLESGHYSNGQSRSALSDEFADGSTESDSLYNLITPDTDLSESINRNGGNFSTNLTELIAQHKWIRLDDNDKPRQWHSAQIGILHFHDKFLYIGNFGGFTDQDIELYGRMRYLLGYEFMRVFKNGEGIRITAALNIEIIQGAHESVNPLRSESTFSLYPFKEMKEFGFFLNAIYGHDNYNLRFVDSGGQFTFGLKWTQWPPFTAVNQDR